MPDHSEPDTALDAAADELYSVPPDEFIGARDAAVAAARERGDRELAKAIGRLRRPTKAAWLANLLARHRAAQLDGLLSLAAGLADAQRTLDGTALRQLSSKRHQLVAAMAREAGRLAQEAGDPAAEGVLRELQGILDAALARPEIAEQVRSGRLTRTLSYTGFGPEADPDAVPAPAPRPAPPEPERETERDAAPADDGAADRARRARLQAERDRRAEALTAAEDEEAAARAKQDTDEAAREEAVTAREDARRRVAELTAELEAAREQERTAATAARDAETAAKASARAVGVAASRTARAQARLEELDAQLSAASPAE
ncbi:hypothetical protein FHX44_117147 [Pseudonocardia hierapolitana]|uniref:Uncharacterized protein n=1 Tax=Pseudonocardia hierapolitana TaxID=1128676 RepID=A0A561T264_9PSEU|nr:hypothetical protein [Pseudonocardia hierapolitana]TWF81204.1 hypothetical protein FHX44_117147 [Pseudonocardia hierapolitana]